MNLYIITARENVELRWTDISAQNKTKNIATSELSEIEFTTDCCLLVHIDSLSKDQITLLCTYWDKVNLIGFSDNPNDTQGIELLLRGFKGYINTFVTQSIFEQLLICIAKGDIWAGTSIVQKMLKRLLQQSDVEHSINLAPYKLSDRETQTIEILIKGASNKEIGRKLGITERTVKAHVSSILQKTETTDRVSLIIKLKDSK
ncbi:MAG: response regulator transcription factor [Oceanospirillaceae bacterium]|nr:response regulator transcription factor [Oceanospirillaceae bacterium]